MKLVRVQIGMAGLSLGMALGMIAGCSSGSAKTGATPNAAPLAATVQGQATAQPPQANPPHHVAEDTMVPAPATGGPTSVRSIPCTARDVVLRPGSDNGDFTGMSHGGTYLTLTNKSRSACSVPGVPQLTFLDANGPVKAVADLPGAKFMHPGPVVLPIVLQPKQSVTTSARWVSGPVYSDSLCYKLTGISLGLRDGAATTAFMGEMCGDRSKGVHYDLQRYGADAQ